MIRGIVFDKDGTLFDFDKTWAPATAQLIAEECGYDPSRMAELASVLKFDLEAVRFAPDSLVIASTAAEVTAAVLPYSQDKNMDALEARMALATTDIAQVAVTDLQGLFAGLRARGLVLGIATNDAIGPTRAHLAQDDLTGYFDFVAGSDSGFGGKPAPGQLHAFCAQTGLAPEVCIMVGDSTHDLHAGRAAGMKTIGVLTGPATADVLAPYADAVLPSIAEIPAWLDRA